MRGMFGRVWIAVVLSSSLSILGGCRKNDAVRQSNDAGTAASSAAQPSAPLDPATLGTLSGTVRLCGKAPVPVKIDMSQDPVCSMTGGDNFAEQYVVHNGKLAN